MFFNYDKQEVIVEKVTYANSFIDKFLGLMFSHQLAEDSGIAFEKVIQVHTFFMRYPIDIFYVGEDDKVIRIDENVKPWRMLKMCRKSEYIVETNAGVAKESNTILNDSVAIVKKKAFK